MVSRDSVYAQGKVQSAEKGDLRLPLLHVAVHEVPRDDEHIRVRGLHGVKHESQALFLDDPPEMDV